MKFRYIIVSTFSGNVKGTNDEYTAKQTAESEDDFVIDTLEDRWLQPEDSSDFIAEATKIEPEEEDDEGEDLDEDEEDEEEGDDE